MTRVPQQSTPRVGRAILVAPLLTTALVAVLALVVDIIGAFRDVYMGAVGHGAVTLGMAALVAAFATQFAVLPVLAVLNSRGILRRGTVIWSTSAVAILTVSALNRVLGIRLDVTSFVIAAAFGALLGYFFGRLAWSGSRVQPEGASLGPRSSDR
jgi:hypothetical protein